MNKISRLYILFVLFISAGNFVFADQPSSSLDDKPSVDSAAVVGAPGGGTATGNDSLQPSQQATNDSPRQEGATNDSPRPEVAVAAQAPTPSRADAQTSYLYDLKKLIEKSRENIKRVNEKIKEQAVLKRNQKREERAREYYEKGIALTDEGKLDEAREYFEKAVRITEHPEMSGYIRESQDRLKKQENALHHQEHQRDSQMKQDEAGRRKEVEDAYKEAVALYKQKKFHPAKDAFEHVEEIAPDYRATASYLKIIDEDIIISDAVAAKQQKVEIARQQKEAEVARAKEKEMWRREIEEKEKQRKDQLNKQAQDVYEQAVVLYQKKKFAEAKKKFEEVSWVVPDYKATMNYLRRIDRDAEEEQRRLAEESQRELKAQLWEQEVARKKAEAVRQQELAVKDRERRKQLEDQAQFLYKAAVALYDNKAMDEALEKFNDIEKTCPEYKSTRMYLARIKQWQFEQQQRLLEEQKRQLEQQKHKLELEVDGIYRSALAYYRASDFTEAKEEFLKVKAKDPDYKYTLKYLLELDAKIAQAQWIYQSAVDLFDKKSLDDALAKFNDLQRVYPNFKAAKDYMDRIKQSQFQQRREEERQKHQQEEMHQLELGVNRMYISALKYYREGNLKAAREEFLKVNERMPDYEFTAKYLNELGLKIAQAAVVAPPPAPRVVVKPPVPAAVVLPPTAPRKIVVLPPPPVPQKIVVVPAPAPRPTVSALSLEDQQKQIQDIAALAERSAQLYRQITGITDDRAVAAARHKMAQVNEIMNKMKEQQERVLRQKHHEQWLKEQQAAMAQQERHKAQVEKMYTDALELLRTHEFEKAKLKLEALESFSPDYKDTRQYLKHIEQDKNRTDLQAMEEAEKNRVRNLRQMQEKEQLDARLRVRQEQEAGRLARQKQEAALVQLASKASNINEDIIRLSKEQNYEGMKAQFDELEQTVSALTTLKAAMAQQKAHSRQQEQFDQQELRRHNEVIDRQKQMDRNTHVQAVVLPYHPGNADQYKRREIASQQNGLFNEAVECYKHRKYTQARLLFGELDDQHDRRAESWLKKVDRAISEEVLKTKEAQERERSAFIAEQMRAQHKLEIIQERERKRQKELTEEWDRQKRLYEQNNMLERQKMSTMKSQQQERQHQEDLRHKAEKEDQKEQVTYRFHKVQNVAVAQKAAPVQKTVTAEKAIREEPQSQSQLNMRKDALHKQLEDGVDAMYQEALRLYKQGQYTQAADKFKDVQDIIPNYKSTGQYIDESRQKAQSAPVTHQTAVSKALDLFDPNVK